MKSMARLTFLISCLMGIVILSRCGSGTQPSLPPTITTPSLPNGTLGLPYSQSIKASGGVSPYRWAISAGGLPHSLQLVTGATDATISGTPVTAAQGVSFTITVTDSTNKSAAQTYTVSIVPENDTLSFSPAAGLSFNPQLVGTTSITQTATLTNIGSSSVVINGVAVSGDFSGSTTCGSSLAAGAKCTIAVTFTPSQPGPSGSAITVTDDTAGSPHLLSLIGIGTTTGPNATLSAASLDFGTQTIGTTSAPRSITLNNYGTTTLNVIGIVTTTNFGETNSCGANLASGGSCTINLTFTAGGTGSETGTLSVTDNAPGNPQTVSLSGSGAPSLGPGNCEVNLNDSTLTGTCFHYRTTANYCKVTYDPTECPAGAQAIKPGYEGIGDCGIIREVKIDGARRCH